MDLGPPALAAVPGLAAGGPGRGLSAPSSLGVQVDLVQGGQVVGVGLGRGGLGGEEVGHGAVRGRGGQGQQGHIGPDDLVLGVLLGVHKQGLLAQAEGGLQHGLAGRVPVPSAVRHVHRLGRASAPPQVDPLGLGQAGPIVATPPPPRRLASSGPRRIRPHPPGSSAAPLSPPAPLSPRPPGPPPPAASRTRPAPGRARRPAASGAAPRPAGRERGTAAPGRGRSP